jgi:hypothetical protein
MKLARGVGLSVGTGLFLVGLARAATAQTTVDGLIYASYRYGLERDSSLVPASRRNNFELDRAYLNVRSKASGGIATRVTVDVDGRRASAGQQTIRLKYAFADWTPEGSAITWRFGMQNTPAVGYIEDTWGYRVQGPVPIDRYRYLSSSDIGLGAEGSWGKQAITAHAGVFNGEGYNGAPGDHRKDASARVSVRLLATDNDSRTGGLRLTGFASVGRATGGAVRNRYLGLLTYQTKATTLGAEYWITTDSTLADAETDGRIVSVFATHQRVGSPVGLIARVDQWDPNTASSPAAFDAASSRQVRVIAGVSYQLAKNVRLLLDADVASVQGSAVPNSFQADNRSVVFHTEIKF